MVERSYSDKLVDQIKQYAINYEDVVKIATNYRTILVLEEEYSTVALIFV